VRLEQTPAFRPKVREPELSIPRPFPLSIKIVWGKLPGGNGWGVGRVGNRGLSILFAIGQ
jgi:hypothetical protein